MQEKAQMEVGGIKRHIKLLLLFEAQREKYINQKLQYNLRTKSNRLNILSACNFFFLNLSKDSTMEPK